MSIALLLTYLCCSVFIAKGGKVRSPTAVFGTFGQCSEAERYSGNAAFFQRGATQGHLPADLIALHCSTINSGLGCIDKQNAFLTHIQNGARFRIANEIDIMLSCLGVLPVINAQHRLFMTTLSSSASTDAKWSNGQNCIASQGQDL